MIGPNAYYDPDHNRETCLIDAIERAIDGQLRETLRSQRKDEVLFSLGNEFVEADKRVMERVAERFRLSEKVPDGWPVVEVDFKEGAGLFGRRRWLILRRHATAVASG